MIPFLMNGMPSLLQIRKGTIQSDHARALRKRLGEGKLIPVIRRIGHKERRKVNANLNNISRQIVEDAKRAKAIIVLGDLKGIRGRSRGRRMNRIVASMPYYKLTQMITYKAMWAGVSVAIVSEIGTSKTCHRCGEDGRRPHQGLFKCTSCGLEYNADLNGAINIAKRFSEQCLENGAAFDTALNSGAVKPCKVDQPPENLPASAEESVNAFT